MFKQDKLRGHKGELLVKKRLEQMGAVVRLAPDKHFPDWDVWIMFKGHATPLTAEVKTDYRVKDTGNVAFEQEAINHTKTNAWFYVLYFDQPEIHLLDILKVKGELPKYKSGNYGEHGELVYLVAYQDFKTKFSTRQL